jgi:fibro-slime domain-containing protein
MPPIAVPDLGPSVGDVLYEHGDVLSTDLRAGVFRVRGVGMITIDGNVRVVCDRFVVENQGRLQLTPGSHLDLYILGDGVIDTIPFPNDVRVENDCEINTVPGDPSLVNAFYTSGEKIEIGNTTTVMWNLYAPDSKLVVEQGAQMVGNFVGKRVVVRGANGATPSRLTVTGAFTSNGGPTMDVCGVAISDTEGTAGATDTGGITSSATFDEWYTDVLGTNLSGHHAITLTDNGTGVFEYIDDDFHPIDGKLLGDDGDPHNYYFTFAFTTSFVYDACADQFFEFAGTDDAWLSIDGKLAMDLGGMRQGTGQYVPIDRLDLVDGETYDLKFFYAQRQGSQAVFRMRTNLPLAGTGSPGMVTQAFD